LLSIDPTDLHEKAFLCEEHFDGNDGSSGDSVPSIFDCIELADELIADYGRNLSFSSTESMFPFASYATQPIFNHIAADELAADYGSTLWNHLSGNLLPSLFFKQPKYRQSVRQKCSRGWYLTFLYLRYSR